MKAMERLLEIMVRLRDPEDGCPWDREQDFASIAPYTIEEAYEVDDAIRRGDMEDLQGELGDLLLQVVYHAQLAHEEGHFDFNRVAEGIAEKLVRRHPHVFEAPGTRSLEEVHRSWEATKAEERRDRAARRNATSDPLGGVAQALPALMRAAKLQGRAKAELEPPPPRPSRRNWPSGSWIFPPSPRPRGKNWGTRCLPPSLWLGLWAWIPSAPCATPTPASRGAFAKTSTKGKTRRRAPRGPGG
jgi:NTP pyrophosphatase (non-canonical NTP hydrolase)